MTTDPLAWVRAEMDAAEKVARAANPGPWRLNAEGDTVLAADDIVAAEAFALSGSQTRATAQHIARHDPAAVLRRIAADRKLLDECEEVLAVDGWEYDDAPTLAELAIKCIAEGWGWTERT